MIDSLTLGGAEALTLTFAHAASPHGLRPHIGCLKTLGGNPLEAELRAAGVPVTHLHSRSLRDLGALRRLWRLVHGGGCELIHAHLTDASIWGTVVGRAAGVPVVATLHVAPPPAPCRSRPGLRRRLMVRLLNRWAARTVAVSGALRDAWVGGAGLDPGKTVVVHNGVDGGLSAAEQGPARRRVRRELGLPPQALVVVTVAALRPGKGLEVLLEAVPRVVARLAEARFVIVGAGPLSGALEAAGRRSGAGDAVLWTGFRRDIPALLAAADLFVLPSLEEAFPTALLEAMAAGLPAVASRVGGIPEIVVPGKTGMLVAAGDAPALAAAIAELLERPAFRRSLGEAARARARREFSSSAWVSRLLEIYRQVRIPAPASSPEGAAG